ncbi:MAG: RNA degradosome polyphosphate kinase [Actinobacteria bacterium]|nr:RNA degradosome polyphosphate kinase [Actinomycetota bacterium]
MKSENEVIDPQFIIDRELSWLDFNTRVLELAEDSSIPLLERVRFLAIFSSNLDDFFMIRVASTKLKVESGASASNVAGYTPSALLQEINEKVSELVNRQVNCFHNSIKPELNRADIHLVHWDELTEVEQSYVKEIFDTQIFPVLTPLAVDPSHPFPYISGLSLSLAVIVKHPESGEEFFARVKVPSVLARFISTQKSIKTRFIALEEIIAAHLTELFPGMIIVDHYAFRLTRNEDLDLEEEDSENILETMEQELLRRKFGPPVRLEVDSEIQDILLNRLISELEISEREVVKYQGPLDLTGLGTLADLDRASLHFPAFKSQMPQDLLDTEDVSTDAFFNLISQKEILLHHPYESFSSSVVRFIEAAAIDPKVLAIKQTLYRTSGDSPIMEALIEAAQAGKQVLAVIEIRARFDELANVRWARKLEEAGVHVVYGLMGLKTHAKLSLVIRQEESGLERYCHVGTGNYNPKTARLYEDLGLLSADPILCDDLSRLFNQLSGFVSEIEFKRLIVAPKSLRKSLIAKIEREIQNAKAGKPSQVRFKLNSLLDEQFVAALYKASQAGVKVEIVVRGICALKPGIPGLSENITVRAILGRFLEHSRIYHFHNAGSDEYWIGSADLMNRNLDRRIETLISVDSNDHKEQLDQMLSLYLSPSIKRWQMDSKGLWHRVQLSPENEELIDIQEHFIRESRARR